VFFRSLLIRLIRDSLSKGANYTVASVAAQAFFDKFLPAFQGGSGNRQTDQKRR
jgi:hypothetical protein